MKLPFLVSVQTPWEARLQAAVLAAARLLLQQERSDQLRSSSHVAAGSPPPSHHGSTPTQTGAAQWLSCMGNSTRDWCLQGAHCAVATGADAALHLRHSESPQLPLCR